MLIVPLIAVLSIDLPGQHLSTYMCLTICKKKKYYENQALSLEQEEEEKGDSV